MQQAGRRESSGAIPLFGPDEKRISRIPLFGVVSRAGSCPMLNQEGLETSSLALSFQSYTAAGKVRRL